MGCVVEVIRESGPDKATLCLREVAFVESSVGVLVLLC